MYKCAWETLHLSWHESDLCMDDDILGIALGDWDGISLDRVRIQQPQA